MPPCGPAPGSSESEPVFATPSATDGWPLTPERMIYDKGPHMASRLHKRAEDLLDYCIDLRAFLEPGETVASASAVYGPLTTPALAVPRVEFAPRNVVVWVDGGKNAQSYQVSVFITTSGGREKLFRFFISVRGDAATHLIEQGADGPANVCAGLLPQLSLSADHVTFPATAVGEVSAPIDIVVTNVGAEKAVITGMVASAHFSYASDSGGTLEGGESFNLALTFHPDAPGEVGGYILIDGNAPAAIVLIAQAL